MQTIVMNLLHACPRRTQKAEHQEFQELVVSESWTSCSEGEVEWLKFENMMSVIGFVILYQQNSGFVLHFQGCTEKRGVSTGNPN